MGFQCISNDSSCHNLNHPFEQRGTIHPNCAAGHLRVDRLSGITRISSIDKVSIQYRYRTVSLFLEKPRRSTEFFLLIVFMIAKINCEICGFSTDFFFTTRILFILSKNRWKIPNLVGNITVKFRNINYSTVCLWIVDFVIFKAVQFKKNRKY